jgi:50S ribosomal protein L16 3-hydroxylase
MAAVRRRGPRGPRLSWPAGLDATAFLANHWQQRPLLLPAGLTGFRFSLAPEELAGLACEPEVESRIVLEHGGSRPWEVRHGPFGESDFARLPESHWTLLVQDVDKHVPEVAVLLEAFRFLPAWRVDDIMISYAADGGSVGPHLDEYDVFLVQATGRRRWRIDPAPVDTACLPDLDLRILAHFEPREEYLLGPGDILYLPPGVPHWGVAEGPCTTWSVGFRAPAWGELAAAWAELSAERLLPAARYGDPGIPLAEDPWEIRPEVFERVRRTLLAALEDSPRAFREWLGGHLTEPKEHLAVEPAEERLGPARLREALRRGGGLVRHPYSRMAWCQDTGGGVILFADGEAFPLPPGHQGLSALLCGEAKLGAADLAGCLDDAECLDLLCRLCNGGHLELQP